MKEGGKGEEKAIIQAANITSQGKEREAERREDNWGEVGAGELDTKSPGPAADMGEKCQGWGCGLRVCTGESSSERQKLELKRTSSPSRSAQCSDLLPWMHMPVPPEASKNRMEPGLPCAAVLITNRF